MKALPLILALFLTLSAWSAPHPGTSSSFLIGQDNGRFISQHGFLLNAAGTHWQHQHTPKNIKNIETMYLSQNSIGGMKASLTVRVDDLSRTTSLGAYMQKWARDYHRFGFDILNSQKVKVGSYKAHMIDLIHKPSSKQLRQVVFFRNQKAVVFTCRDNRQTFLKSLKSCNEIIRSFRWARASLSN